jgi:hypothetical protein
MGRDSSVGIATRYWLDGLGIEFWWGRDFAHTYRLALGPRSLLYNGYRVFPEVKRPGRGVDHPRPSSAEVKESVGHTSIPPWAFVACSRVKFTFTFTFTVIVTDSKTIKSPVNLFFILLIV